MELNELINNSTCITQDQDYETKANKLKILYAVICFLASIGMILFASWLIIKAKLNRRLNCFEMSVLVSIIIFYTVATYYYFNSTRKVSKKYFECVLQVFVSMNVLFPSFYHWMFVSQYWKTCQMLPSFIRRHQILEQIHQERATGDQN